MNLNLRNYMKIIGAATGLGAQDPASGKAPFVLKKLIKNIDWQTIIQTTNVEIANNLTVQEKINQLVPFFNELTNQTKELLEENIFPLIIGGDHSCAIGSWRALLESSKKDIGLIWFDAHLDSHTFNTTPSKAIHGMPLACLLGYGEDMFIPSKVLKPENVVVFGARSWECGERELLDFLNVRIYDMTEINSRGLNLCFNEALEIVNKPSLDFGFSLDLDMFDPIDIPAVCSKENFGIEPLIFLKVLENSNLLKSVNFKMAEIVEFAPEKDSENKTLSYVKDLITVLNNYK